MEYLHYFFKRIIATFMTVYATVIKSRPPEADGELDLCIGDKIIVLNQVTIQSLY